MFNTGMSAKGWSASGGKKALLPFLVFGIFAAGIFLYSAQKTFSQTTSEPAAPSDLTAEYLDNMDGTFTVELFWVDNEPSTNNNEIYWTETSDTAKSGMSAVGDATSYTYSAVAPGTYDYKVRACTSTCSSFSNVVTITLETSSSSTSAPSAPALNSPQVSGDDVYLSWTDSDTEETYNVYRGIDSASLSSITQGSSLPADSTSYTDSGLADGTYYYMVKACNLIDCTESNTVSTTVDTSTSDDTTTGDNTTNGTTDIPIAPSGLTASVSSDFTQVSLSWTDNATNEESYKIYKAISGSTLNLHSTKSANTTSYMDSHITEGESYNYGVSACNTADCSSMATVSVLVGSLDSTTDEEITEETTEEIATVETAAVSGVVKDPFGTPLEGILVKLFNEEHTFAEGVTTDSAGFYAIDGIPAGTYYIKTYVPQTLEYISAPREKVELSGGDAIDVNLQLRNSEQVITGKTYINGNIAGGAFVWAWSDEGGYRETKSASDGSFSLSVASGTWHLSASREFDGALFKQHDVIVDTSLTLVRDLNLEKEFSFNTSTKEETISADQEVSIKHDDGAEVVATEGTFAESGTVTLSIAPDIEAPSQEQTRRAVGVAYNIEAKDVAGTSITTFSKPVSVKVPYKEGEIAKAGGNEDNLKLNFWDETTGSWTEVENSTVDKVNNFVSADVDHFTRFAVLTVISQVDLSGIADGDLIKTADNPDVYIAKFVGTKKFKRLILNPDIFNSYGHLKWENIKTVTQAQMDAFFLSELTMEVYPDGTPVNGKVYRVTSSANSDVGISHRLDITAGQFEQKGFDWDSIYHINEFEASPDFYPAGPPVTSV